MKKKNSSTALWIFRYALHSKDVGSSPVAFKYMFFFFFQFASLFVIILDFAHNRIYLFESGMRLCNKYTRNTVNNFNKPTCN